MAKEKTYSSFRLFLLNGEEIEVEYPVDDNFDEAFFEMLDHIKRGDIWWVENYPDWEAKFMGNRIEHINCRLVVGYNN